MKMGKWFNTISFIFFATPYAAHFFNFNNFSKIELGFDKCGRNCLLHGWHMANIWLGK
jgi:hypothetical protein